MFCGSINLGPALGLKVRDLWLFAHSFAAYLRGYAIVFHLATDLRNGPLRVLAFDVPKWSLGEEDLGTLLRLIPRPPYSSSSSFLYPLACRGAHRTIFTLFCSHVLILPALVLSAVRFLLCFRQFSPVLAQQGGDLLW